MVDNKLTQVAATETEPVERVQTLVRIPVDLRKRAEHWTIDHDTTLQALIAEALEQHLDRLEKQQKKGR